MFFGVITHRYTKLLEALHVSVSRYEKIPAPPTTGETGIRQTLVTCEHVTSKAATIAAIMPNNAKHPRRETCSYSSLDIEPYALVAHPPFASITLARIGGIEMFFMAGIV